MLDVSDLKDAIANRDAKKIAQLIKENNLTLQGQKITANETVCHEFSNFWDKRQLVKKINLNSLDFGRG
jgi:uncharacterized protein YajQ (UPF0234 family)